MDSKPSGSSAAAPATRESLVADLRGLGIREGDHLGLGISFRSLGPVEGGPLTLVNALMDAVGPHGTIMIPTFTNDVFRTDVQIKGHPGYFDPAVTPAYTGVISEMIRRQKGAIRSRHPNCSIAAIGERAAELTQGHGPDARAYMPYSRLAACGGKVLCIGLGDKLVGIRHEAQSLAGLLDVVPLRWRTRYLDEEGHLRSFVRLDSGGCETKLPLLVQSLREQGRVIDGFIGRGQSIVVDADDSLRFMTRELKADPTSFLCNDISCLWCRELERRMNLYPSIREPRYFQRSMVIAHTVGAVNWLRLLFDNADPRTRRAIYGAMAVGTAVLRAPTRLMPRKAEN